MEEKIIKIMQLVQIKKDNTVEFPEEARKLIREVAENCRFIRTIQIKWIPIRMALQQERYIWICV